MVDGSGYITNISSETKRPVQLLNQSWDEYSSTLLCSFDPINANDFEFEFKSSSISSSTSSSLSLTYNESQVYQENNNHEKEKLFFILHKKIIGSTLKTQICKVELILLGLNDFSKIFDEILTSLYDSAVKRNEDCQRIKSLENEIYNTKIEYESKLDLYLRNALLIINSKVILRLTRQ